MSDNAVVEYAGGGGALEDFYEEPEFEKIDAPWVGGIVQCLSVVSTFCGGKELKKQPEDNWEIPIDSIEDMFYLGAGAQGVVFGAKLNGEYVAVKKLRDAKELNIKHLRKLNHDNIVRFYGVCSAPPTFCIIMEYCQYGALYEFIHSGACFSTQQVLKWSKDIALGMSYLHSHRIIHRDLKSPNILISDNLVVKVSDFGTSREWNDISATMSFTGTVAWMAPEVIRHELCSERVDVWSYGVVLWELLTQDIPYKTMEAHAIMWGVGTNAITLPIPASCPGSLRALLTQCWHRSPKNRPPFKIIVAHLDVAGDELNAIRADNFRQTQAQWRSEIHESMREILHKNIKALQAVEVSTLRYEELKRARNTRNVYEQQLKRANDLYMEVCAVRLQLEQREKDVSEREKALEECKCSVRKKITNYQRQASSSSDGVKGPVAINEANESSPRRPQKKKADQNKPAQLVVNYEPKKRSDDFSVVTRKIAEFDLLSSDCPHDSLKNNNMGMKTANDGKVDTVLENNGNILLKDSAFVNDNDKFNADLAQV